MGTWRRGPSLGFGLGVEITCRVYKPRRPRESPLFRLVEQHPEELLRIWPARLVRQHGRRREILADPLYRRFVELIPLGNRAEDYGVMLSILDRDAALDDQGQYDEDRAEVSTDYLEAFHTRFYEIRTRFQQEQPRRWHALLRPYPELVALLGRRSSEAALAIATAKDRRSVRPVLDDHGLSGLFPDELFRSTC